MNQNETIREKPTKGHRGYLRHRKTVLLLRSVLLLTGIAGILLIGYVLTKSLKNWLTIFAAVTAIPLAMQLATYFSVLPFIAPEKGRYDAVKQAVGSGILDTELLIANKDGIAFPIDFAYIHPEGIFFFSSGRKIDPGKVSEYVRNFLRLNDEDAPVKVETDFDRYLREIRLLPPSDRDTADEKLIRQEGVLRSISM